MICLVISYQKMYEGKATLICVSLWIFRYSGSSVQFPESCRHVSQEHLESKSHYAWRVPEKGIMSETDLMVQES